MSASKEQECKALERIEAIVKALGEDSYVAWAFKGCFEDALLNITNDFALSMYDRVQSAEHRIEEYKEEVSQLKAENFSYGVQLRDVLDSKETREAVHAAELEAKDKEIARLQGRCDDLNTLLDLNKDELEKQAAELTALRSKGQVTEQELITLKARLYDLMVENR